jgi:transcriptional regulator with XRE-family HTH domain
MAGFAPGAIAHFEARRRDPGLKSLVRLADALGVSIDALAGRERVVASSGKVEDRLLKVATKLRQEDLELWLDVGALLAKRNP